MWGTNWRRWTSKAGGRSRCARRSGRWKASRRPASCACCRCSTPTSTGYSTATRCCHLRSGAWSSTRRAGSPRRRAGGRACRWRVAARDQDVGHDRQDPHVRAAGRRGPRGDRGRDRAPERLPGHQGGAGIRGRLIGARRPAVNETPRAGVRAGPLRIATLAPVLGAQKTRNGTAPRGSGTAPPEGPRGGPNCGPRTPPASTPSATRPRRVRRASVGPQGVGGLEGDRVG